MFCPVKTGACFSRQCGQLTFCSCRTVTGVTVNLFSRRRPPSYIITHCHTDRANCFFFLDVSHIWFAYNHGVPTTLF